MKTYQVGEHVVYRASGVCLVEEIRTCRLTPDMPLEDYYILKPLGNPGSTVFVPTNSEQLLSKMREVLSKEDIDGLLRSVKGNEFAWIEDRKERASRFREILSGGDRRELILLIRCILGRMRQLESGRKKLSTSDQDILQAAERAVKEEFSFSLNIPKEEIPAYIRQALRE